MDRCGQIDQSQPRGDPLGANVIPWDGRDGGVNRLAQTFRVMRSGRLAAVRVQMHCPPGAEGLVEIQTTVPASWGGVQPSGQVLASRRVNAAALSDKLLDLIVFDRPPAVQSSARLAVVFRSYVVGLPSENIQLCWVYIFSRNPYPGGEALQGLKSDNTLWERWISNQDNTPEDLAFETIVVP
jgi:hypothetical protein